MSKLMDLTGQKFGRLTVISKETTINSDRKVTWNCRCECGNLKTVSGRSLKCGYTKSCGCYRKDITALKHRTHGLSKARVFNTWNHMMRRVFDPKTPVYKYYGGRGIRVCKYFQSFENFVADMGEPPARKSLDRIDVNGHYSCGHCEECVSNSLQNNCRWATNKEQQQNTTKNHSLTYLGETKCIAAWADSLGMSQQTLLSRIVRGWSVEDALSTPSGSKRVSAKKQNAHNAVLITYKGETKCIYDWAKSLGIRGSTLSYRIRQGWSIEDAFTPKKKRKVTN